MNEIIHTGMYIGKNTFWSVTSFIWIVCIGFLSLLPPSELPGFRLFNIQGMDKILHALFYLILSILLTNAMFNWMKGNKLKLRILSFSVCASYGLLIEIIQPLTGRSKSFSDFLADIIGTTLGIFLFYQVRIWKNKVLG